MSLAIGCGGVAWCSLLSRHLRLDSSLDSSIPFHATGLLNSTSRTESKPPQFSKHFKHLYTSQLELAKMTWPTGTIQAQGNVESIMDEHEAATTATGTLECSSDYRNVLICEILKQVTTDLFLRLSRFCGPKTSLGVQFAFRSPSLKNSSTIRFARRGGAPLCFTAQQTCLRARIWSANPPDLLSGNHLYLFRRPYLPSAPHSRDG